MRIYALRVLRWRRTPTVLQQRQNSDPLPGAPRPVASSSSLRRVTSRERQPVQLPSHQIAQRPESDELPHLHSSLLGARPFPAKTSMSTLRCSQARFSHSRAPYRGRHLAVLLPSSSICAPFRLRSRSRSSSVGRPRLHHGRAPGPCKLQSSPPTADSAARYLLSARRRVCPYISSKSSTATIGFRLRLMISC